MPTVEITIDYLSIYTQAKVFIDLVKDGPTGLFINITGGVMIAITVVTMLFDLSSRIGGGRAGGESS